MKIFLFTEFVLLGAIGVIDTIILGYDFAPVGFWSVIGIVIAIGLLIGERK